MQPRARLLFVSRAPGAAWARRREASRCKRWHTQAGGGYDSTVARVEGLACGSGCRAASGTRTIVHSDATYDTNIPIRYGLISELLDPVFLTKKAREAASDLRGTPYLPADPKFVQRDDCDHEPGDEVRLRRELPRYRTLNKSLEAPVPGRSTSIVQRPRRKPHAPGATSSGGKRAATRPIEPAGRLTEYATPAGTMPHEPCGSTCSTI